MKNSSSKSSTSLLDVVAFLTVAILLALPLYRPYIIGVADGVFLYPMFVIGALSFLIAGLRCYAHDFRLNDYLIHIFVIVFMVFATVRTDGLPWGKQLLVAFLYLSYMVGRWIGLRGRTQTVMAILAVLFFPVSVYVVYQLAQNDFSYHTYINWSNSALKVSYLDFSLYSGVLFLFAQESAMRFRYKLPICVYLFTVVMISGARYSILFLVGVIVWKFIRGFSNGKNRKDRSYAIVFGVALIGAFGILAVMFSGLDLLGFSTGRLTSLLGEDNSVQARLSTISMALEAIGNKPMFGFGMDQSSAALGINYPHNIVLEVMLEGGIFPGLIMTMVAIVGIRAALKEIQVGNIAIGVAALYVIGAFFKSFSLYEARATFFLLGALSGTAVARAALRQHFLRHRAEASRQEIARPKVAAINS